MILLVLDMYDPHRLWAFPGTHTPQIQQIFTAQQAPLQHQVIGSTSDRPSTDYTLGVSYPQTFQSLVNKYDSLRQCLKIKTVVISLKLLIFIQNGDWYIYF